MAQVTFPSFAQVSRSDLQLIHPGQIVHRSAYGTGLQVLSRGPGYWSGLLAISELDSSMDSERRQMEIFLANLRGQENTFDAPLYRPSKGDLSAGTVLDLESSAINTDGELVVTYGGGPSTGSDLLAGDYVSIGNRLFQLVLNSTRQGTSGTLNLLPGFNGGWALGIDILWEDVGCRARVAQEEVPNLFSPDFSGPWNIRWEEAIA